MTPRRQRDCGLLRRKMSVGAPFRRWRFPDLVTLPVVLGLCHESAFRLVTTPSGLVRAPFAGQAPAASAKRSQVDWPGRPALSENALPPQPSPPVQSLAHLL